MPDDIKGAVEEIKASNAALKTDMSTDMDKKFAAAKELADAANKKIEDEVKQLNEDMAKRGATLEEIRNEVLELKKKKGRWSVVNDQEEKASMEIMQELFRDNFAEIKSVSKSKSAAFESKTVGTMTASANLTGAVVNTYSLTPAIRGRRKVHFQDLVNTVQSATGLWSFYRSNTPPGEGSFSFQTTHGNAKSQLDYDLTKVDVTCEYLAGYTRFAKQMAQDLPFLQTFLAGELLEDYRRQESFEYFGTLRSSATGTFSTAGSVYAEKLINTVANLMDADYDPNGIVTTAAQWAVLLTTKPNDYSIPGGVTISPAGEVQIVGIPVYVANSQYLGNGTNKTIVGDWTKAMIIQVDGLRTEFFEQDQDNVIKNLITARVERRVGLAILRPDAFAAN